MRYSLWEKYVACCLLYSFFVFSVMLSKKRNTNKPTCYNACHPKPWRYWWLHREKGYEILESKGKTEEYTLDKKRVYNNWQIWAVQYPEPDHYLGKEISIYSYIIRNHPLDDKSPIKNLFIRNDLWKYNHWRIFKSVLRRKDISLVPIGGVYSLEGKNLKKLKILILIGGEKDLLKIWIMWI